MTTSTRTRRTRKAAGAVATIPGDFPGAAKIQRLLDGAKEHGWAVEITGLSAETGAATVAVEKDGDRIVSEFISGKSAGRAARTVNGAAKAKLPNVSAVLHAMAGTRPDGRPIHPVRHTNGPLNEDELARARKAARGEK